MEKVFWFGNKKWRKAYEKIIDMGNNNDYTAANLLDYAYYKNITN